jgi:hypothetical protein
MIREMHAKTCPKYADMMNWPAWWIILSQKWDWICSLFATVKYACYDHPGYFILALILILFVLGHVLDILGKLFSVLLFFFPKKKQE